MVVDTGCHGRDVWTYSRDKIETYLNLKNNCTKDETTKNCDVRCNCCILADR